MSLFDTIKSSYDLGPGFHQELQTKDLANCCCHYWISPVGQLFEIDYGGTQDWSANPKSKGPFIKFTPNGNRGKVRVVNLFNTITVYPAKWDCKYAPFPRLQIHFDSGIIRSVCNCEDTINPRCSTHGRKSTA